MYVKKCVKKQRSLVDHVWEDACLDRARWGVAAMRQDRNYQLDTTKLVRKNVIKINTFENNFYNCFSGTSPLAQQEHAPQTLVDAWSEISVVIFISQLPCDR